METCPHCGISIEHFSPGSQLWHVDTCKSYNANRKDLKRWETIVERSSKGFGPEDKASWFNEPKDFWAQFPVKKRKLVVMPDPELEPEESKNMNIDSAKNAVSELLTSMGEDVSREGLLETPRRVAEMYEELTSGYHLDPKEIIEKAIFQEGSSELVIVRDIPFYSLCEHHLAPFFGTATIGYVPTNGRVVGLSKLARVLDAYAKRLQVQERLGAQIADALYNSGLSPLGVGVYISAEHLCMAMRGVQKPGTSTVTNTLRGSMKVDEHKEEWMRTVAGR
jgi:GTP cyclohydrolase I